jgi:hypothetical protein
LEVLKVAAMVFLMVASMVVSLAEKLAVSSVVLKVVWKELRLVALRVVSTETEMAVAKEISMVEQ